MKKAVSFFVVLFLVVPLLAGCAGSVGERMKQGAVIGGAAGALGGYGAGGGGKTAALGAAAGMILGAAVGAVVGMTEDKAVLAEPQPLPWLAGKSIQVVGARSHGYGVDVSRPVIEDQLRRRGAVVVDSPGPQYWPQGQPVATDFVAEVAAVEKSGAVIMDIRVLDQSRQVKAIGSAAVHYGYGGGYGYSGDYRVEALRTAGKNAVWALH